MGIVNASIFLGYKKLQTEYRMITKGVLSCSFPTTMAQARNVIICRTGKHHSQESAQVMAIMGKRYRKA